MLVDAQIIVGVAHGLEHLVGRHDAFKAAQRDGVLHARIVRVEGDDVGNAHRDQLLEHHGAVHGLAGGAAMLAAFVEHRHDDVDAVSLSADRRDDALEIGVVLVRRHRNLSAIELVGALIRAHVADDEQIIAANGILNHALALAGAEARAVRFQQEAVLIRAVEAVELLVGGRVHLPVHQILVDPAAHFLAAVHGDDAQRRDRPHREFLGRLDVLVHA